MKKVRQGYNGCGPACVAMIANVSYSQVMKIIKKDLSHSGTTTKDLIKALKKLGIKTISKELIPIRKKKYRDLDFPAILKVNPRNNGINWHWVVWDNIRKKILDPMPLSKTYKKYRVKSYLGIKT